MVKDHALLLSVAVIEMFVEFTFISIMEVDDDGLHGIGANLPDE